MQLNNTAETITNCTLPSNNFKIQASPIAFEILSSKLYTDPILAIVRELLTNAYESQCKNGNPNTPIHVHLPTWKEKSFIVRDYGTGLSDIDIKELYTTFFSSTKSNTNDFTGCFGLGSKTPFAYSNSFSIISYHNGYCRKYLGIIKDGYPAIISVATSQSNEPTGLEIKIPVKEIDKHLFNTAITEFLQYVPEIKTDLCLTNTAVLQYETEDKTVKIYNTSNNRSVYRNIFIKQGQNVYTIPQKVCEISKIAKIFYTLEQMKSYSVIVIEVPIGTLEITPSREHLSVIDNNVVKIKDIVLTSYQNLIDDILKNFKTWKSSHSAENSICYADYLYHHKTLDIALGRKYARFSVFVTTTGVNLCLLNYYNRIKNPLTHNSASITEGKTIIVLTKIANLDIEHLKNTYSDLKNVTILILHCTKGINLYNYRMIRSHLLALNSLTSHNFDISFMTYHQLKRKYPKLRMISKQTKNYQDKSLYQNIFYTYGTVCLDGKTDLYQFTSSANKDNTLMSNFVTKNTFNTFVLREGLNEYNKIKAILYHINIQNKQGDKILFNYFKSLSTYLDKIISIYGVSRTVAQYTQNLFPQVKLSNLKKAITKDKYTVYLITDINKHTIYNMFINFDYVFLKFFPNKVQELIKKTYLYQKFQLLKSLINKGNVIMIEPYHDVNDYKILPDNYYQTIPVTQFLGNDLYKLYSMFGNLSKCYQVGHYNGVPERLKRDNKNEVLKLFLNYN